jgi:hypothetical protein
VGRATLRRQAASGAVVGLWKSGACPMRTACPPRKIEYWQNSGDAHNQGVSGYFTDDQVPHLVKTSTLLAGMTMAADDGSPCIGGPSAVTAPAFPTTQGLGQ